jgi:site-specific recombinase XerD
VSPPFPLPPNQPFNPVLHDLIADYAEALRAEGRSPRTIAWYGMFLREFCQFASRADRRPRLYDLSAPVARRWLVALRSRPRPPAPASLAGRVRSLRAFASWLKSEFDLDRHPLQGLKTPRVPHTLIHSLRDSDVRALLTAAGQGRFGERDTAVLLVLLDSGIRLSELTGLHVGHVDFENGHCRVMGKGAKERRVPIGRSARRALRRTLLARGRLASDAALFVADRGGPLTASGVQKIVRRAAQRAGLEVRCSPHVLRHTFARSFLANGGDVFSLQRILGHSPASLDVTRRYVELLDEDLREVHRRASPMDLLQRQ